MDDRTPVPIDDESPRILRWREPAMQIPGDVAIPVALNHARRVRTL